MTLYKPIITTCNYLYNIWIHPHSLLLTCFILLSHILSFFHISWFYWLHFSYCMGLVMATKQIIHYKNILICIYVFRYIQKYVHIYLYNCPNISSDKQISAIIVWFLFSKYICLHSKIFTSDTAVWVRKPSGNCN